MDRKRNYAPPTFYVQVVDDVIATSEQEADNFGEYLQIWYS